jgi:hypothetical protein
MVSASKPQIGVTGHVHTIDDICERDRPKGTTSDQSKPLVNKRVHLLVLKEITSAMRFDKESHPRRKSGSPPDFHFLYCNITHVRNRHQVSKHIITSSGLTMIMNSSVECASRLYTTLVTVFGMVVSVDEYPVVGYVQKTNYDTIRREYAVRVVE